MDRRHFIVGGAMSCLTERAFAQAAAVALTREPKALIEIASSPARMIVLAASLEAIVYIVETSSGEEGSTAKALIELQRYTVQLTSTDSQQQIIATLSSENGSARVKQNDQAIQNATNTLKSSLSKNGVQEGSTLNDKLAGDFAQSSQLLTARSADNASWWCQCYGFRKILFC